MSKITAIKEPKQVQNSNKKQTNKQKMSQMSKDGILVDNFVKDKNYGNSVDFDEICDKLLISENSQNKSNNQNLPQKSSFNMKNALMPLFVGTAFIFAGAAGLSGVLAKSSKALNNIKPSEQLPDLARNMNIKQEPQFATYRMLRDPSTKNIIGAGAVFLFSGMTAVAKNLVDGVKEVWIKKRQADIERDLQESLIETETKSFAGKIQATNDLLRENITYFKNVLSDVSFKGKDTKKNDENKDLMKLLGVTTAALLTCIVGGKITFSNIKKGLKNANDFTNKYTEATINAIKNVKASDKVDLSNLEQMFQAINAKPQFIKETLSKLNMQDAEINRIIDSVSSKNNVFSNAPTALGGIPEKIQYYCYLDEDRGHLYNWVINPENKFTKYLFLAFTAITSVGYVVKQGIDAVKTVAVSKENAKTELDLKKRLVDVEVANFKSKKAAAIVPLKASFNQKMKEGKSKEELKGMAENILLEIKNGPPYIFG